MKVIYVIATGEIAGNGSDGISADPPHAVADAPANFLDYPMYFWIYVDPDIVLKTGQPLADAQAKEKYDIASRLIEQYTAVLGSVAAIVGSMESMLDINNQMLNHFVNGTVPTQDEKIAWNLVITTCTPKYKLLLVDVTQAIADAMLARKSDARDAEAAMKADPDWPY